MIFDVQSGLFERAINLFQVIDQLPESLSAEEVEGLMKLLPSESRESLSAFFIPRQREAGISFLKMMNAWLQAAVRAREQGKKVILVPFNFPPELVLAFDNAVPLTSEVLTTIAAVGLEGGGERYWNALMELGLPDHVCSSNAVEIGSVLTGKDFTPDAIISAAPGGCDANSKIHEFLAVYLDIPQFILEKPVDDTPEGHQQYELYFRKLIRDLEAFVGEQLTEEKLRRLLGKANRCAELFWDLHELRKAKPSPVPNLFNLFLAPTRFCMWGTDAAIEVLETMVDTAGQRFSAGAYPAPEEKVRALWAYTSYYFNLNGLHSWMEESGYTLLADVLSLYMPQPIDLSSMDTMIAGMVEAAWDYPMNRQMGASSMSGAWVRDVVHIAREMRADCVIYSGHDACKQTWSVVSILQAELERRSKIPLLTLHGDSWRKTTTPITVIQKDIDEFIKTVVLPKKRGRKTRRRRRKPAG